MLTKQQHASLEFIVDVVVLLWVATKIVMSCPHLRVTSSTGAPVCGRALHKTIQYPPDLNDPTFYIKSTDVKK